MSSSKSSFCSHGIHMLLLGLGLSGLKYPSLDGFPWMIIALLFMEYIIPFIKIFTSEALVCVSNTFAVGVQLFVHVDI